MNSSKLSEREVRLVRYALEFLESSLDANLAAEAGQEIAPETQTSGEPLPDVQVMIRRLKLKLRGIPD